MTENGETNGKTRNGGYRVYDDAFRATALLFLEAAGGKDDANAISRAAKSLGIPRSTLVSWANGKRQPPTKVREGKALDLGEALRNELDMALQAMGSKRCEASYKELGIVVGILADKMVLLSGDATETIRLIMDD